MTQNSARPILFSAPMVRAILAGTKTQTRRVCKAAPDEGGGEYRDADGWPMRYDSGTHSDIRAACPYGKPGDRLWVREAWRTESHFDRLPPRDLDPTMRATPIQYEAGPHADVLDGGLRPGIHMPRWASRITLDITAVRVERLQDISEADAMAEGAEPMLEPPDGGSAPHVAGYRALWESINGPGSWAANPWVWVVEFERAERVTEAA